MPANDSLEFTILGPGRSSYLAKTSKSEIPFYIKQELNIKLKDIAAKATLKNFLKSKGYKYELIQTFNFNNLLFSLKIPKISIGELTELNNELQNKDYLSFAELNLIKPYSLEDADRSLSIEANSDIIDLPNDIFFDGQWYLHNDGESIGGAKLDADIDAPEAWFYRKGQDIKVAILDSGFDLNHVELKDRVVAQRDIFKGDNSAIFESERETHGTSVASLVAAEQNNVSGMTGIAPEAKLILIRITDAELFADDKQIAEAIIYAVNNGADIISNSWAFFDPRQELGVSSLIKEAIAFAQAEGRAGLGTAVVFAAGNNSSNTLVNPLTKVPGVITVSSVDHRDSRLSFSNFGDEVFITAPSSRGLTPGLKAASINNSYTNTFSGTSASTPMVSAVLALALSANPKLSLEQLRTVLRNSSDKIGFESDYDKTGHSQHFGYGRLNAHKAILEAFKLRLLATSSFSQKKKNRNFNTAEQIFSSDNVTVELLEKKKNKYKIAVKITDPDYLLDDSSRISQIMLLKPNSKRLKILSTKISLDNIQKEFILTTKISKNPVRSNQRLTFIILDNNNEVIASKKFNLAKLN